MEKEGGGRKEKSEPRKKERVKEKGFALGYRDQLFSRDNATGARYTLERRKKSR